MKELFDVTVLGLGPAGTIAAHRAARRGWDVVGFDPAGPHAPSTVGLWATQVPEWLPDSAIASRSTPLVISGTVTRKLDTEYLVLRSGWEQDLGGFIHVDRFASETESRSAVTLSSAVATAGTPRQIAYGYIVPEAALPEPQAVLMDFSPIPGWDEAPLTFSYRIPLGDGRWLLEETILATTAPSAPLIEHLKLKGQARLELLGVDVSAVINTEVVDFPLVVSPPHSNAISIGSAGQWIHPATGYSVGALLSGTDGMLDRIAAGKPARSRANRLNHQLRLLGLQTLLRLSPTQTREFFGIVFELSPRSFMDYLIGEKPGRTAAVMIDIYLRVLRTNAQTAWAVAQAVMKRNAF